MKLQSDEKLSPELREEVQDLRGIINKGRNSSRFVKIPDTINPCFTIIDTVSNKSTTVPLYALSNVMDALYDLFEK